MEMYYQKNGLALEGYDVVSYFNLGKPVKGHAAYQFVWSDLTWQFINQEHLEAFKTAPQKYAPAYGGYCAYGCSNGYKAKPKMAAFTVHEGRLYLNFAHYVKRRWLQSVNTKISSADERWAETRLTRPISADRRLIWLKYQFLKLLGIDLFE